MDAEDKNRGYLVEIGQQCPDFELELTNGETVKISDLKGKVIMLQFTASWCSVCRQEMPHIENEIWLKHKNNPNFALFGIDRDEPLQTVIDFAKAVKITYPLGLDPDADVFGLFADKKAGVTRNVIINKDGKIVYLTRLFNKAEFEGMKQKIDSLLEN